MGEASDAAKKGLPADAIDVSDRHPKEIQGHKVDSTWEQPCGCRLTLFDEDGLTPQHDPCVPHGMKQAGVALIATAARMIKDIEAAAKEAERPVIHRPGMDGGRYGRGPGGMNAGGE